jgi:hypothetical protein
VLLVGDLHLGGVRLHAREHRNAERLCLHGHRPFSPSASLNSRLRACFESREQLLLPEGEETVSVTERNDRDSIEPGPCPLLDRFGVSVDVGTTGNGLRYVLLAHIGGRRLEVDRIGQLRTASSTRAGRT